jgi:histone acetyltransferase 1
LHRRSGISAAVYGTTNRTVIVVRRSGGPLWLCADAAISNCAVTTFVPMDFNLKRSRAVFDAATAHITADSSVRSNGATAEAPANPLVRDSNECIQFVHLRPGERSPSEHSEAFGPLMSHQIYGEDEEIRGYIEPRVDVTLSPLFLPLVEVSYGQKVLSDEQVTALMEPMKNAFAGNDGGEGSLVMTDRTSFEKAVADEEGELDAAVAGAADGTSGSCPLGEIVLSTELRGEEKCTLTVYRSTLADASELVKKIHQRMEPMLLFFIDAASAIDAEDPCWEFLLCTATDESGSVRIVGMATVYAFYVYPDQKRFRLSQAFVMPPEQGKGIGSAIVDAVFVVAKKRNVVDITLEDPTDDFRRLRDRKDLRDMLDCDWVTVEARAALEGVTASKSSESLQPNPEMMRRLCEDLMMNMKQAERMWESLLYKLAVDVALDDDQADEGTLVAVVEGWMSKNIEAGFVGKDGETKAKEVAANKVIKDTPTGFWMYKESKHSKKQNVMAEAGAAPVNVANMVPVNEVTDEKQQDAIAEYVQTRIAEVRALIGMQ